MKKDMPNDLLDCENNSLWLIDPGKYRVSLSLKLKNPGKENVLSAINALEKRDDVLSAQPNEYFRIDAFTPDDPELDQQWAVDQIDLRDAWGIEVSRNKTTIGVIDSGIDADHPDLAGQVNRELGADFVGDGAGFLSDPNGHGTHVSGIIGAVGNNKTGVAGTNWSVNIVSIRVFNEYGGATTESIAEAISYASANNIPVINFSGGGLVNSDVVSNAINQYPGLMIFAAGNNGWDNTEHPVYPASYDNPRIIAVASSGIDDELSYFSNYSSTQVHLAAPGENILSTLPDNSYGKESGTSMAARYVTGVATLIMSVENSDYVNDPLHVKSLILGNVDTVSALHGKVSSSGRLNAYKALLAACGLSDDRGQETEGGNRRQPGWTE
jgi:subtilisin family serine protease